MRPRVLVAAQPVACHALTAMLGDSVDVVPVESTQDAFRVLEQQQIDLVVCTVAFDESRMMEFLQTLKGTAAARIPFLCARVLRGVISDQLVEHMRAACLECGAADLVDVANLAPSKAQAVMRAAVKACLDAKTG
jgi:response regulator RpfG family c-di-GMP phosphodiesterase